MKNKTAGNDDGRQTRGPTRWLARAGLALLCTGVAAAPAWADSAAPIPVELNKLEALPALAPTPGAPAVAGCRAYVLISNPDPVPIGQLRLDLVVFGTDGVILRRLALDLAPLAGRKIAVHPFDMPGQPCDGIGRLLVNDVLACQIGPATPAAAEQDHSACLDRLQPTSRAKAEMVK